MPQRPQPSLVTLILLTGLSVLALNMFLPSLARMADDFGVSYALAALSVSGFLVISALLQIIMGPLSDMYGRRPIMLGGLVIFTLASAGCLLAQDIRLFLFFRVLQAAMVTGMVLSRAVVRDIAPREEAARLLGQIGMVMALAPLLGPVFGGFLDEVFGWRANFVAFTVMGAVMFWVVWTRFGETNQELSESFGAHFRQYPALVSDRLFWAYSICLVFSIAAFYGFLGGAALVGEELFGLTPSQVGMGLGSISGGFMLGNFLTGRLSGRIPVIRLMLWGRSLATLGPLVAGGLMVLGLFHPAVLFGGAVFVGLGNGLTLPGANAGVMSINPRLAGAASGLSGAMTVLGGAIATSLTGTYAVGQAGGYVLLGFLSLSSLVGLAATLWIGRLERA